ncbi:hypothetical protein CTZ27_29815 [Streptomyces griseocarneus]|nr:hypothetical protein CTZ27_29815 [Streptomyces griseocarneus]
MPQASAFDQLLTLDTLRDGSEFEIPSQKEYETHWAAQPHTSGASNALGLPHAWRNAFFSSPHGLQTLGVWVDPQENWLWAAVPTTATDWYTPEQTRTLMLPLDHEVIPQWVQHATPNWKDPAAPLSNPSTLLVRRKLEAGQATALLEELLPPLEQYPLPAPRAQALRAGGWTPEDLATLWWTIDTEADATALAAHPPLWWKLRDWPLDASRVPEPGRKNPLAAAMLADLATTGVTGGLFTECMRLNVTAPERIKAVRVPQIPDDATRVLLTDPHGATAVALDAATARRTLQNSPRYLLGTVTAHTGNLPLASVEPNRNWRSVTVWEDGLAVMGLLMSPAHTSTHGLDKPWESRNYVTPEEAAIHRARREWEAALPRRYEATEQLLRTVASAVNFPELGPELWSGWIDATSVDSEPADNRLTDRALAADAILRRELTLTRHTVHAARAHEVWVVAETVRFDGSHTDESHRHWATGNGAQARALLEELTDGLPPVMTVEEAAQFLGTTRDALAQAIARAKRNERQHNGRPALPYALTLKRTDWYDPRKLKAWWLGRPGRGSRN